ncbi:OmpH family outer membrane protein [Aquimarina brevivitae]|uniref:Periplasmic chaperone for outer membrane proteins Skp n=1 Tax=Aquimarina brevivitae TaxID=323412 RepID=A0A4Q7P4D3_9FLAO|nr:OmpH family outer membrane protein [Aquimarina brevivitae]RZS93552.1 periplasmic chaperone for outer membrane proteins Skp [Aquimarina brevivitae]
MNVIKNCKVEVVVVFIFIFCLTTNVVAQKVAYMNTPEVLQQMAEYKEAGYSLRNYQEELQNNGKKMVQEFQKKQKELEKKVKLASTSSEEQQRLYEDLEKDQKEILAYEKEIQVLAKQKEAELLIPVQEKLNKAVQSVCKEKNYLLIVNASALLYADESLDVTALVIDKLNQ